MNEVCENDGCVHNVDAHTEGKQYTSAYLPFKVNYTNNAVTNAVVSTTS